MKHNVKITLLLLTMFLIAQFIGLYVTNFYSQPDHKLPFGLGQQPVQQNDYYSFFTSIIVAFILAILIFLVLIKYRVALILKLWFFFVVFIALVISWLSFLTPTTKFALTISIIVSFVLAVGKIFGRNFIIHNLTELIIYPGIAAIFVPILNVVTIVILLIIISVYDMWAVWHSGIMQKMAKYQISTLKIFSGFFVPYMSKKIRDQVSQWKRTMSKSKLSKKKIKLNVAILGGGDVVFPIITAGVMLKTLGLYSALLVIAGALLGLGYLFIFSEKKKFYPAMPFISAGIFFGILISYLIKIL